MDAKRFGEGSLITFVGGFRIVYLGIVCALSGKALPPLAAVLVCVLAFLLLILPMLVPLKITETHVVFCSWFLWRRIPIDSAYFAIESGFELLNTSKRRLVVLDLRHQKTYSVFSCLPEAGECWEFLRSVTDAKVQKSFYMVTVERNQTRGNAFCMKLGELRDNVNFTVIGKTGPFRKIWNVQVTQTELFDPGCFVVTSDLQRSKLGDFWIPCPSRI